MSDEPKIRPIKVEVQGYEWNCPRCGALRKSTGPNMPHNLECWEGKCYRQGIKEREAKWAEEVRESFAFLTGATIVEIVAESWYGSDHGKRPENAELHAFIVEKAGKRYELRAEGYEGAELVWREMKADE